MENETEIQHGDLVRQKAGETDMRVCSGVIKAVYTECVDSENNTRIDLYSIDSLKKIESTV